MQTEDKINSSRWIFRIMSPTLVSLIGSGLPRGANNRPSTRGGLNKMWLKNCTTSHSAKVSNVLVGESYFISLPILIVWYSVAGKHPQPPSLSRMTPGWDSPSGPNSIIKGQFPVFKMKGDWTWGCSNCCGKSQLRRWVLIVYVFLRIQALLVKGTICPFETLRSLEAIMGGHAGLDTLRYLNVESLTDTGMWCLYPHLVARERIRLRGGKQRRYDALRKKAAALKQLVEGLSGDNWAWEGSTGRSSMENTFFLRNKKVPPLGPPPVLRFNLPRTQ